MLAKGAGERGGEGNATFPGTIKELLCVSSGEAKRAEHAGFCFSRFPTILMDVEVALRTSNPGEVHCGCVAPLMQ